MQDNDDAFWLDRTERARAMIDAATTIRIRSRTQGLDAWDQWLRSGLPRHTDDPTG